MTQKTFKQKKKIRYVGGATTVYPLKLWQDERSSQEVRIEIIPLIDVIFCILTFFILAAVGFSRQQAISLDLPKASTANTQMREMLIVSIDNFGQTYVEQEPVNMDRLYDTVEHYFLTRPSGLMVLHASKNAKYEQVIQVLDILREVGGDRVALGTLPKRPDDKENNSSETERTLEDLDRLLSPSNDNNNTLPELPTVDNIPESPSRQRDRERNLPSESSERDIDITPRESSEREIDISPRDSLEGEQQDSGSNPRESLGREQNSERTSGEPSLGED